ncbi:MAG: mechanosensitive ion channel domain-containing protein [Halobacteriaceae archaeon]
MPRFQSVVAAGILGDVIDRFLADVTAAAPRLLAGVVFLVVAGIGVKIVLVIAGSVLDRGLPGQDVYQQVGLAVFSAFLWFAVLLAFLAILGLNQIAAALGTATGFVALGVSYALSGMLADAVAGIYLLRDPDFSVGDRVTAGDMTGTVEKIDLRKTRFDVDGDTVVRANADVEKRWTRLDAE